MSKTQRYLYFAYGANLNIEQMTKERCRGAQPIGKAVLPGYTLEFRRCADVTKGSNTDKAYGGLWLINQFDLAALDRFEGYPRLYTRQVLRVSLLDVFEGAPAPATREDIPAIVYLMTPAKLAPPTLGYLGTIIRGYEDFGLELAQLNRARVRAAREGARCQRSAMPFSTSRGMR